MICKPGELVLIPFPYSDLSSIKKRPVLVLTPPDRFGDFIALAVTSVEQTDKAVILDGDSLIQGKLPSRSWIRIDKVFTLSSRSIVKAFGSVSDGVVQATLAGVCATLGYKDGR